MITFGSLFAGIGGFDIGFERASMQCLWQVEIDGKCNSVRRKHWPTVSHYEDVKEFHAEDTIRRPDIICGGFPCQDLSVAGRRAGLAGERSGLFHEFMRVLAEFRPGWVCIENVPGLLSSNKGRDMGTILGTLGQLRYRWAYRVLDAQYFGLAQRRKRVFIVGSLGNGPHPAEILFDSESLSRNPPTRGEAGEDVADCFTAGSHPGGHNGQDDTRKGRLIVGTLNSGGNNGGFRTEPGEHIVCGPLSTGSTPNGHGMAGVNNQSVNSGHVIAFQERGREGGREVNYQEDIAYSLNNPGKGGRRQENCVAFSQNQRDEVRDLEDKAGALASEPGMHQQTFLAGAGVRRLTPRECERLQGFLDDFTRWDADGKEISDSARYRMLGNAVAVPVAEWIGKRIVECIS